MKRVWIEQRQHDRAINIPNVIMLWSSGMRLYVTRRTSPQESLSGETWVQTDVFERPYTLEISEV